MTPERWQQVKGLLATALELDDGQRANYLDQVCVDDPSLRSDLERLIAAHKAAATTFLQYPAFAGEFSDAVPEKTLIGRRMGAYQIVAQIGAGGMGEVYRAFRADDQYRKEVAIKLLRSGPGSQVLIQRFKNERQVLASLDHPNIARLLDGGATEEGIPYLVMELIEGEPLVEYCDHRKLTIRDRLVLFLQVCSAVQYAHQRLIIHRDLKPNNILVNAEGIPKLLDFGIAKILDPAAGVPPNLTISIFQPLTPAYASPEQIKGETITTASDVYSSGVLLYELLTGHRPYRIGGRASHEVAQAVCDFEPERPSSVVFNSEKLDLGGPTVDITPESVSAVREGTPEKLSKRLKGDVDNIILMALRKEPQRRYASIEQLGGDIRRHLTNLPVMAAKDTVGYRTSKFIRRHKGGVAATAMVVIALLTGMTIAMHESRIARAERARAESRFNDVRKLANSLLFEVHDSIKDLPGATPARKLLVSRALQYLDSLAREAGGDASLQEELATAYERVGDVQGNPNLANLGDISGAIDSFRKALTIRESLVTTAQGNSEKSEAAVANDYERLGSALMSADDCTGALGQFQKMMSIRQRIAATDPTPESQERLAAAYFDFSICHGSMGELAIALQDLQKSAALRESIVADSPAHHSQVQMRLAGTYGRMSGFYAVQNNYSQAILFQRKAEDIMGKMAEQDPTNATYKHYQYQGHYWAGFYLEHSGDFRQALHNYQESLQVLQALSAVDPNEVSTKHDVGLCQRSIGALLIQRGDEAAGRESMERSLATFQDLFRADTTHGFDNTIEIADTYSAMGQAYAHVARANSSARIQLSNWQKARSAFDKSFDTWLKLKRQAPAGLVHDEPNQLSQEISRCDSAIAKLRRGLPPR
jgi:eukaryotic-like serine/threonine-protein kinase